jgi:hypothetical protein
VTEAEDPRKYGEQLFMAFELLKLMKAEGNPASDLLSFDIKVASIARSFKDMNTQRQKRPPVPLKSVAWFRQGVARKARIPGPLV